MRNNTNHGLFGAVLSALLFAALALLMGVGIVRMFLGFGELGLQELIMLIFGVAVCLAFAVGVVVSLAQRIREVKGGEEDEARKY